MSHPKGFIKGLFAKTHVPSAERTSHAGGSRCSVAPISMSEAHHGLIEVDSITIKVVVDNEVDPISPSGNAAVQHAAFLEGIPLSPISGRGAVTSELRMSSICCGAHGLSLMITATTADRSHTLLFDTGPEGSTFSRNASRTQAPLELVEHIHLSHWHRDHSGGMLEAIREINNAKVGARNPSPVVVEVHPDRPDARGMLTPSGHIISLEPDPSLAEIAAVGGHVQQLGDVHPVLDGYFLASGAIPRRTAYEVGIRGGQRFEVPTGAWVPDEAIADERLLVCHLRDKGLVVFTGCSHAGVINVCRHAVDELGGGEVPLYAVIGGFHLADNNPEKLARTLEDLTALKPSVLMPGHCTGWRFKAMCEAAMPAVVAPSFCGTTYTL